MARVKNSVDTIQLTVSTTPQVRDLLDQLVKTGLYGKNPAEAAERLIADSLRSMHLKGELGSLKTIPDSSG
ncbi:MAG: hypothetical protein R3F11_31665 [Verrucomicrobiales bacterium]